MSNRRLHHPLLAYAAPWPASATTAPVQRCRLTCLLPVCLPQRSRHVRGFALRRTCTLQSASPLRSHTPTPSLHGHLATSPHADAWLINAYASTRESLACNRPHCIGGFILQSPSDCLHEPSSFHAVCGRHKQRAANSPSLAPTHPDIDPASALCTGPPCRMHQARIVEATSHEAHSRTHASYKEARDMPALCFESRVAYAGTAMLRRPCCCMCIRVCR